MNQSQYTMPSPQKSRGRGRGSGPKGPRYTYKVHLLELKHCFTCPLSDCVGDLSQLCPIYQERRRQKTLRLEAAA